VIGSTAIFPSSAGISDLLQRVRRLDLLASEAGLLARDQDLESRVTDFSLRFRHCDPSMCAHKWR
jgi:hypothetical protein